MANYGPANLIVEYDNSGGTPVVITAHVLSINDVEVEQFVEEVTALGASWQKHLPIGVGKLNPVELSGLFDDTAATSPDALFANRVPEGPATTTRTLKITWGGTKTTSVETHLISYVRTADKNGLTKYKVKLQPTGTVTEA
jgi:hypothetical protein